MINWPKIKINWVFNGFRWSDKEKNFPSTFTSPHRRRNYHVIMYNGKWCVHGEGAKQLLPFPSKQEAINYAKANAEGEKTEVLIHNEKGGVETAWMYAFDSYPQEELFRPDQYPLQNHPGETML